MTPGDTPPAGRSYAIGDIHGRLDLLERAIAAIRRDVDEYGPAALTVTLGDYVDRGPQSRGVIERLAVNPFPTPYVALKGNHEYLLETFLADPETGSHWCEQGGLETLASYGIVVREPDETDFAEIRKRFMAALPARHLKFLRGLTLSVSHGKYFFCHAGVRPGVPLEQQSAEDLLWIRRTFLYSTADFGKIVVHGHTPLPAPDVRPNQIGIDTGAFTTDRLTCVALEEGPPRFLDV